MADALVRFFRSQLPPEIAALAEPYVTKLENGQYEYILQDEEARKLFGLDGSEVTAAVAQQCWTDVLFSRLGSLLADRTRGDKLGVFFCVGYAALLAFLQSNVTGPPLSCDVKQALFPSDLSPAQHHDIRKRLLASLGIDGIAPYSLTPHIELLCVADAIMSCPPILKHIPAARWAKVRVEFVHQRLLQEVSSTLQNVIYDDLDLIADVLFADDTATLKGDSVKAEFLVERASIHIHHGLDKFAREDLEAAKTDRRFEFALTGLLGKRTKFQENDISQLVVLAKSDDHHTILQSNGDAVERRTGSTPSDPADQRPKNLNLDDDTLLESISFSPKAADSTQILDEEALSSSLAALDPGNQPQLESLDSSILLALASSITNTSPQDGLTREETLPYATRVLEGGSTNWQVYTQALLIRSRVEGYKSRTVERGLLQLQVLVDQIIAETTGSANGADGVTAENTSTTFLPRPKESESAPVTERLRYIFQLASPTRWDIEAELASRWTSLGGLRSALEIYERLEMWAEAALCWAATEREDKARRVLRKQLFHATNGDDQSFNDDDDETWSGPPRDPPPVDAPRLYCILGDIDQSPELYEKAWEVSKQRYARAQRSLGRHFFALKDHVRAAEAYSKSLKANQLNHASWFALGCTLLELQEFEKAASAFSRCVQLDDTDAESWSNLAAALLRRNPTDEDENKTNGSSQLDEDEDQSVLTDTKSNNTAQKYRQDALKALKRAAALKHDSYRIWQNVLVVAASVSPRDYVSILTAQKHIAQLRGSTDGEKCIDVEILELLVQEIIVSNDVYDPEKPGFERLAVRFIDETVVPLITSSATLWRMVSKLAVWRGKPLSALDAEEKAWRVVIAQPGWETESEARWNAVVEATVRLCDSYESLGQQERTEGMGAGTPVAKDWRFKARTAVRGILGRGKASWEGSGGWDTLKDLVDGLKQ